jgi:hypothetical protein
VNFRPGSNPSHEGLESMTKATRVHSTPPTNTPIDTTRRHLLTIAAGGAVAAAIPTVALAAAPVADPIYAAIEAHREAVAVANVAYAESARLHRLANEIVGPHWIEIPNRLEPGTVMAMCVSDINEAVPRDEFPDLNEHYREQLRDRNAERRKVHGDTDKLTEGPADAAWDALDEFMETVPTTLLGLLTMVVYATELFERNEFDDCGELLQSFATAAKAVIEAQAGKAVQS